MNHKPTINYIEKYFYYYRYSIILDTKEGWSAWQLKNFNIGRFLIDFITKKACLNDLSDYILVKQKIAMSDSYDLIEIFVTCNMTYE